MYDVIIIGGSYAGLTAALQLGRARRTVLILDACQQRNCFASRSQGFLGQDGQPPEAIAAKKRWGPATPSPPAGVGGHTARPAPMGERAQ